LKKTDIAVIGGGIHGCSIAYNLAKKGCKNVAVFEKDYLTTGSTGRCAGGVRQQFGTEMNCILARESVRLFESLSEELDYDIELNQGGYLVLAYLRNDSVVPLASGLHSIFPTPRVLSFPTHTALASSVA